VVDGDKFKMFGVPDVDAEVLLEAIHELTDGFVLFDQKDRMVACNRRYKEIYEPASSDWGPGTPLKTIARDTARHCLGLTDDAEIEAWVDARVDRHHSKTTTYNLQEFADGRWVQVNERRLENGMSVGVRVDVSALKRSELRQRELLQHSTAALESKSVFLAKVSHEMRTPLNAIIGFSALMEAEISGPVENEIYQSYIADIHKSGTYLLDLINNVLELSQDAAPKKDTVTRIDLKEEVGFCVQQAIPVSAVNEQKIELRETLHAKGIHLAIDRTSFRQILTNLLNNAMKFSPEGSEITVSLRQLGPDRVTVTVADRGAGISPRDIGRVKLPFEQGELPANVRRKGLGLGLAIVVEHCEANGGRLAVKSQVGQGTVMRATLPISQA